MNLVDAFIAELDARINPGTAYPLSKQVYTRTQLAEHMAGTTDHKSKAYKAARRNLERYDATPGKEQRKPSNATLQRLTNLLQQDDKAIDAAFGPGGDWQFVLDGEVTSSQDTRWRHIEFTIPEEDRARVLMAVKNGRDAVLVAAFQYYGFVPDEIANENVRIR